LAASASSRENGRSKNVTPSRVSSSLTQHVTHVTANSRLQRYRRTT
jgi:hypothetical protein